MVFSKKEKRNRKGYLFIIIGILLILFASGVLIYRYYENKNLEKIVEQSIEVFFEEEQETEIPVEEKEEQVEETKEQVVIDYMAVLEIPKINLKRGLVDINSKDNNVNKNVYIVKESTFPNKESSSHIILAAHSGTSYISFFKNLNKLKNDDIIKLYYNNKIYSYKVSKIYEVDKVGKVAVGIYNTDAISLITCISGTEKQLVVEGIISSMVEYE